MPTYKTDVTASYTGLNTMVSMNLSFDLINGSCQILSNNSPASGYFQEENDRTLLVPIIRYVTLRASNNVTYNM